ncbi:hypothetical protein AM587_10005290 [Phytophthora nicotianae]|uniref:Neutral zinc metallopeptidase n=1 Tax=Phytophthora nicotianae TaxID=4792 RepID=A0A0W8CPN4_PHYNI|nr:hypothetical protein AM587_10005290 [Phytophthora nicotianae]
MKATGPIALLVATFIALSTSTRASAAVSTVAPAQASTQQQEQQQQYTNTDGSTAIGFYDEDGTPVVAETTSNYSSSVPTFGDITSKPGECVTGNPNEYITAEALTWVWENRIGPKADLSDTANWNVMASKNWLMDHIVHNNGSMNYCVRWDSDAKLSKSAASKFQGLLERHYNEWNKWLVGYNCWPFEEVKINVVSFAAKDVSQFEWTDDSLGKIYEGIIDPSEKAPKCPDECHRYYDNGNNMWSDTSACEGEPFDVSFRLNQDLDFGYAFGFDWGEEVSSKEILQTLQNKNILVVGHEIGHGFGHPDFYTAKQKPKNFPPSIMMGSSSVTITPSDGWMLRRILEHLKPRYNF